MRIFLRGPVAGLGALVALACAGCSTTPDAAPDTAPGDTAQSPAPRASSGGSSTMPYAPYVSATTAAATDGAGSPVAYNLAFAIAAGGACRAAWDGTTPVGDRDVAARIAALKSKGTAVRVSFGGQAGKELAATCHTPAQLAAAYGSVLDAAKSTEADFDIEGPALTDAASVVRRAEAIALLQKERGLKVTFTLPVMPTGLDGDGTALLKSAKKHGVNVSTVNIMTMSYGSSFGGDMADYAVQAATATHDQVQKALGLSPEAAWKSLALTSMIGVNDVKNETFTLDDAARVREFAAQKGIGWLSMWTTSRDQKCPHGKNSTAAQDSCSGVAQTPGAFAAALSGH
ncbi:MULTISPECIES: chitinase [unclassified Streptomyces]|uniref:chitinase n=1 Tax=unclassified Streptomyces TaxID=2593676 RepID=UPI00382FECAB